MDAEALRRTSMELGIADEPRSMKSSVNMNGSSWKAEAMRSSFEWKEKVIRESTIRYTTTSDKIKTERLLDKRGSFVSRNLLNQISSNSGMARLSTVVGYKRASRISAYDIGSDETENEEIVEDIWDSLNRIDMDVNHKPHWFLVPFYEWYTTGRLYFTIVTVCNVAVLSKLIHESDEGHNHTSVAFRTCLWNFLFCILIRSEFVIFLLHEVVIEIINFRYCLPNQLRHQATECLLHLGSVHASTGIMSILWLSYAAYSIQIDDLKNDLLNGLVYTIIGLVVFLVFWALPPVRHIYHDPFEWAHRYGGWTALIMLWSTILVYYGKVEDDTRYRLKSVDLFRNPEIYVTIAVTLSIFLPWFFTRKVPVRIVFPSKAVAFLYFEGFVDFGRFARISRNPFDQSHAFAISATKGSNEHFLIVGAVGDFTKGLHTDPPKEMYTRLFKFTGLSRLVKMYKRVVIMCTGAGVAVFNSIMWQNLFPDSEGFCFRLLWVASNIPETFGQEWADKMANDERVLIYDTKKHGRPDMVKLTLSVYDYIKAEVVFITSNPDLTMALATGCKQRGVHAFGPIFDS